MRGVGAKTRSDERAVIALVGLLFVLFCSVLSVLSVRVCVVGATCSYFHLVRFQLATPVLVDTVLPGHTVQDAQENMYTQVSTRTRVAS